MNYMKSKTKETKAIKRIILSELQIHRMTQKIINELQSQKNSK